MSDTIDRRDFLKAAAVGAGALIVQPSAVRGSPAGSKVELGLTGCGGRGNWIAELFNQSGLAKIVAVHDYFKSLANAAGERLGVDASRRYWGMDGHKKMLEGKLDGVVIQSPPYFHPQHAVATIEAGKHAYIAKPIAVDAPGAMSIVEAGRKAKDKLSVWVDFQTRMNEFYQGAAKHVHDGLIGQPVSGQANYYCGRLGTHAKPGTEMARLRNWAFDIALSGDIIVEQNIHAMDVVNWFLKAHPVKAYGTGGRKARTDVGDCWDHFVVTYWYPNDVLIDFSSGQFTYGYDDIGVRIYGSLGTVDAHYGGNVNIRAKTGGYRGGQTGSIYKDGAVANIKAFCESIAAGKPINNAEQSADSTMTCVLGRIAAYENRVVTWDEMIKAAARLDPKLNLPPDGPDWKG
jgi:predicted dehydrogenase